MYTAFLLLASAGTITVTSAADTNDWVNPQYVLAAKANPNTQGAQKGIISSAGSSARQGPWTVTSSNVKAASGDSHDYLSWAPYHWPNCNWCAGTSRNSASHPEDGTDDNSTNPSPSSGGAAPESSDPVNLPNVPGDLGAANDNLVDQARTPAPKLLMKIRAFFGSTTTDTASRTKYQRSIIQSIIPEHSPPTTASAADPSASVPANQADSPGLQNAKSSKSTTSQDKSSEKGSKTSPSKCTPSPASSIPPSATWTTCPYVTRDGEANPDVRTIPDVQSAVSMPQAVLYNALAFAMSSTASYSSTAASFISTYFLNPSTAQNPTMEYGQLVRGPGKQDGSFTGVLDLRGMVKVVNAVLLLRAKNSADWTSDKDASMTKWSTQYLDWLKSSALGNKAYTAPNNHGTFYVNQFASLKILVNDMAGAKAAVQGYFSGPFQDQVAQSGEQPFEAVRTRPYHYRCFNLEAMITNAKLGDQIGLNLWTAKSRYGSNIQKALDYTMALSPGSEDQSEILPHVAAVAAAYGDPTGKYAAFLKKLDLSYNIHPYWYYDQVAALPNSPNGSGGKQTKRDDFSNSTSAVTSPSSVPASIAQKGETVIQPVKPAAFDDTGVVQLDDGVFVTWDQIKPFYTNIAPMIGKRRVAKWVRR